MATKKPETATTVRAVPTGMVDSTGATVPTVMAAPKTAEQLAHEAKVRAAAAQIRLIEPMFTAATDSMQGVIHDWMNTQGFWEGEVNVAEKICLMHSELSEAMEGARKDLMDDHLPNCKQIEVELADTVIRILDFCGRFDIPLGELITAKMLYNLNRPFKHGKAF